MTSSLVDLSQIKNACDFKVELAKDGQGNVRDIILHGTCTVKDTDGKKYKLKRRMSLVTLVHEIRSKFDMTGIDNLACALSDSISGPLSITIDHSGGWLSDTYNKAVGIAKKIGENRIAQDVYNDILPEVAPYIPGASAALDIAHKAHDIVVKARKGSGAAIDKVKELASSPSTAAKQVVGMMKRMAQLMDMKRAYEVDHTGAYELVGRHKVHDYRPGHHPLGGRTTPTRPPTRRQPRQPNRGGIADHRTQGPPPPADPYADYGWTPPGQDYGYYPQDPYGMMPLPPPPPQYNEQYYPQSVDPYASFAAYLAQQQSQSDADARQAYAESLFDPTSENYVRPVEEDYIEGWNRHGQYVPRERADGWLYNKPYRDPLTTLQHMNREPAFIHRYLYNRGMGRG